MKNKYLNIAALIFMGCLGIFLHVPLFFGIDFLFGSIFSFILLMIYGLRWAVLSAVIINIYTIAFLGHPYAYLVYILEIVLTGLIKIKTKKNLLLCNSIFWLLIGSPVIYVSCKYLLLTSSGTAHMIMLKQACNGILNVLIANVILIASTKFKKSGRLFTFRELLFNIILILVSIPILFIMVMDGRAHMEQAHKTVTSELTRLSENINQHMNSWFEQHLHAVRQLAEASVEDIQNDEFQRLQDRTIITTDLFTDFHNMYIADQAATTIAFHPETNNRGESTIGLNFSDRDYYKQLKLTHKPVVSEVFVGRGGVFSPIITISAPILDDGRFLGYALAALDLDKVRGIIHQYLKEDSRKISLIDKNNSLIASTDKNLKVLKPYVLDQIYRIEDKGKELYSTVKRNGTTSGLLLHRYSHHVFETQTSKALEWKLIIEYPIVVRQADLFNVYTRYFSIVLCLILVSSLVINVISKELSHPLIDLAESTTMVSDIVLSRPPEGIKFPESTIFEMQTLIENFQKMTRMIELNFQSLKESEEKYRLAMDASTDGLWDWKIESDQVYYSPSWSQIIGEANVESVYESWKERIHPDDKKRIFSTLWAHLEGEDDFWQQEHRLKTRSGKWKWVLGRGRVVERSEKGEPVRMMGTMTDITNQKKIEHQLKESEAFYREFFDNSPTALYLQDFSKVEKQLKSLKEKGIRDIKKYLDENISEVEKLIGNISILEVNNAAVSLYKAQSKELLKGSFKRFIKLGDHQHIVNQSVDFFNGADRYEEKARNLDLKGNTLDIIIRKAVIERQKNGLSKVFVSITDVTDLYQMHSEKRALEKQLHQAQKMETIGTLAGGIAHDFNNILFPILGYSEILLDDIDDHSPLRPSVQEINISALRARDLVKQILTFSRQEKGETRLMKLQPILKETLKMIRATIPATIDIFQEIDPDCGVIKADPTQIHQVIMNILTNAYQSINAEGRISVSLFYKHLEKDQLPRMEMRPGIYNCLVISDTGSGMDPLTKQRMFEPFFTTKERGKGTGMGLSVVHGIITKLNGGIDVETRPGKGTKIRIYFPVRQRTSGIVEYEKDQDVQGGPEHILIVDDEKGVLDLQKNILERLGYRVTGCNSGTQALETFLSNPGNFDLIITDLAMPKMPGNKLALKMIEAVPDIPIIMNTGFSDQMDPEIAAKLGIRAYLTKPVMMRELAKAVRMVLGEEKLKNESRANQTD